MVVSEFYASSFEMAGRGGGERRWTCEFLIIPGYPIIFPVKYYFFVSLFVSFVLIGYIPFK
jgi:hypothetical protein